jgi:hypothetical protein
LREITGTMGKSHAAVLALLGLIIAAGWFLVERALDPERRPAAVDTAGSPPRSGVQNGPVAPSDPDRTPSGAAVVGEDVVYTPRDVEIFRETVARAEQEGLDTLGLGEIMVRVGRWFVGNTYTPHTLDPPGPERLIVNLREFDCVTYVESMLALGRVIRDGGGRFGDFTDELRRIRYRHGTLDGYTSRLHYFSEWIADNEDKGLVDDVAERLDGVQDDERIDFMTTHVDAYPQLDGNPDRVERIREVEQRLSARGRLYVPQSQIAGVADGIRNGDIIAATSSVDGLDIAHTGLALWQDGDLHLMHAPLIGSVVEISEQPLAVRIRRIDGQDGIMVARPL